MNRRDALKVLGTIFGGAIYGADVFSKGTQQSSFKGSETLFSANDISLLDELGETIIPTTSDSQGAKAAKIGEFMQEIVSAFYSVYERADFVAGLNVFKEKCAKEAGISFVEMEAKQRIAQLSDLQNSENKRFFKMLSQLTTWGYFSSEVGATQARRHVPIPGRWEGCIELKPGQKSWA